MVNLWDPENRPKSSCKLKFPLFDVGRNYEAQRLGHFHGNFHVLSWIFCQFATVNSNMLRPVDLAGERRSQCGRVHHSSQHLGQRRVPASGSGGSGGTKEGYKNQSYSIMIYHWLVVWNMTFMTFHILGMLSSQLTNSYFSEGLKL